MLVGQPDPARDVTKKFTRNDPLPYPSFDPPVCCLYLLPWVYRENVPLLVFSEFSKDRIYVLKCSISLVSDLKVQNIRELNTPNNHLELKV